MQANIRLDSFVIVDGCSAAGQMFKTKVVVVAGRVGSTEDLQMLPP